MDPGIVVAALVARGMSGDAARSREGLLQRVLTHVPDLDAARAWWVPGRIELLGKHTDYAGGRSLLAATHRGFWFVVSPRPDATVRAVDCSDHSFCEFPLSARAAPAVGTWANYPMTVARRLTRNFDTLKGADFHFISDLPRAAGLSSSSAMIVGFSLGLMGVNALAETPVYRESISSATDLSGYLGTIENGQSFGLLEGDLGVGTFGGSEDHTAILNCRGGQVEQYRFCPIRHERSVSVPDQLCFVIGSSGVVAEKTGAAMARYNRASALARAVLATANEAMGTSWLTLADAVRAPAADELRNAVGAFPHPIFRPDELIDRLDQFVVESERLVPLAAERLAVGDLDGFGNAVEQSQTRGADLLRNQIPETTRLAAWAREEGAVAASAFGAGFGGSVWAAVTGSATDFLDRWRGRYLSEFPHHTATSEFFITSASPGAFELS